MPQCKNNRVEYNRKADETHFTIYTLFIYLNKVKKKKGLRLTNRGKAILIIHTVYKIFFLILVVFCMFFIVFFTFFPLGAHFV